MNDFYYSVFLETCTRVLKIQVCSLFLIIVIPVLPSLALCTDFFFFLTKFLVCLIIQRVKHLPAAQETWVGKTPGRREWQTTPVFLPEESHGWRSLVGYSPRGRKESDSLSLSIGKLFYLQADIFLFQLNYLV